MYVIGLIAGSKYGFDDGTTGGAVAVAFAPFNVTEMSYTTVVDIPMTLVQVMNNAVLVVWVIMLFILNKRPNQAKVLTYVFAVTVILEFAVIGSVMITSTANTSLWWGGYS